MKIVRICAKVPLLMSPEKLPTDMWGLHPGEFVEEDFTRTRIVGPMVVRVTIFDPHDYPGIDERGFMQVRELIGSKMIILIGTDFAASVQKVESPQDGTA